MKAIFLSTAIFVLGCGLMASAQNGENGSRLRGGTNTNNQHRSSSVPVKKSEFVPERKEVSPPRSRRHDGLTGNLNRSYFDGGSFAKFCPNNTDAELDQLIELGGGPYHSSQDASSREEEQRALSPLRSRRSSKLRSTPSKKEKRRTLSHPLRERSRFSHNGKSSISSKFGSSNVRLLEKLDELIGSVNSVKAELKSINSKMSWTPLLFAGSLYEDKKDQLDIPKDGKGSPVDKPENNEGDSTESADDDDSSTGSEDDDG
jgi:hypothetical protein